MQITDAGKRLRHARQHRWFQHFAAGCKTDRLPDILDGIYVEIMFYGQYLPRFIGLLKKQLNFIAIGDG